MVYLPELQRGQGMADDQGRLFLGGARGAEDTDAELL
jgi:hypothetical protein